MVSHRRTPLTGTIKGENMLEITKYIKEIKRQIGIDDNSQDTVLKNMFVRYLSVAKSICNRVDEPPEMIAILIDVIAGAYNQRGGEGFNSSTIGGQSYNHQDLYNILHNRLVNAGLRIGRF